MYKNILIATDGSEVSGKGLEHGLRLAKALGARATIVNVTEGWASIEIASGGEWASTPGVIEDYERSTDVAAKAVLDAASAIAAKIGVAVETIHIRDQLPAPGIIAAAEEKGADLIVMASHGRRGLGRLILGSQANEVLVSSKIPVLIVR